MEKFAAIYTYRSRTYIAEFKHKISSASNASTSSTSFPFWKLTNGIATFTILYGVYAAWLVNLMMLDQCTFAMVNLKTLGIIRVILMLRILLDPIICVCTDLEVSDFRSEKRCRIYR